ncbi:MAG: AAC(3) family N-acetyltransferase [Melioribacteraceae bacterium]|nr:AAC(3) family N-acetyltransferase [Melioribacteraceae bacterium]
MEIKEFINILGIKAGMHLMVHSSIKQIQKIIPDFWAINFIDELKKNLTNEGSLIMPTFTYNFKKSLGKSIAFNKENSESKVGMLTDIFRTRSGVIRTSSPTHSFALWGNIRDSVYSDNSPVSPLGGGSVPDWMTSTENSYILLLGTDFRALSYGHYLESIVKVPWSNVSPWDHLQVLPIGVSNDGLQKLQEIPGCGKPFVNFEKYLLSLNLIHRNRINSFSYYLLSVDTLYKSGLLFFKNYQDKLLCPRNTCQPCDERRRKLAL